MTSREAFEAWYDAQPDGRIQPWDVWQAATAAELERCAKELNRLGCDHCAEAIMKKEGI